MRHRTPIIALAILLPLSGCTSGLTEQIEVLQIQASNSERQVQHLKKEIAALQESDRQTNASLQQTQRQLRVTEQKANTTHRKLDGLKIIVTNDTIQLDSEHGYPIPRRYHRR